MRLDKFICETTGLTRSQAHKIIRSGRIRIEGVVAKQRNILLETGQAVTFDDRVLELSPPRYLMLFKPAGYECTTGDSVHPVATELMEEDIDPEGLHYAGRLDVDATGLVLLTDDGAWSHRVTAPRHKLPKVYRVDLDRPLDDGARSGLEQGVELRGEKKATAPARVETLGDRAIRLTITEGRYHQVKRMLAAVGNHVTALHRERIGPLCLDADMEPGDWRELSPDEIALTEAPITPGTD
ncbi:MAG: pseudouridine synthase [Gammaproteobacteria bacterium]